ncbi:hypothetical protein KAR91_42455 [Candidatus Pacearchaeota archaeon]|nr:hypothetical protein [Candidatus Pacearchaeota archaeon]
MNRERSQVLEEEYLEGHPGTAGTVKPFVYDETSIDGIMVADAAFPFPLTSDLLLSDEWEEAGESWFVDSSGRGGDGEPALAVETFRRKLAAYVREHPDHGFGISGVGQFQLYVSAYKQI